MGVGVKVEKNLKKSRSSKADATMQKILQASLERIIKYGESGISMTEISREIGVSRPTLYRYFPTREALLESVFDLVLLDYAEQLQRAINKNPDPLQRVEVIANFVEARLLDGGAQLFQLDPKLIIRLISRSEQQLLKMSEPVFAPLFDMSEALSGKKIDRQCAAHVFMLFNSALAFFNAQSPTPGVGDMLRKMIRALTHFD